MGAADDLRAGGRMSGEGGDCPQRRQRERPGERGDRSLTDATEGKAFMRSPRKDAELFGWCGAGPCLHTYACTAILAIQFQNQYSAECDQVELPDQPRQGLGVHLPRPRRAPARHRRPRWTSPSAAPTRSSTTWSPPATSSRTRTAAGTATRSRATCRCGSPWAWSGRSVSCWTCWSRPAWSRPGRRGKLAPWGVWPPEDPPWHRRLGSQRLTPPSFFVRVRRAPPP